MFTPLQIFIMTASLIAGLIYIIIDQKKEIRFLKMRLNSILKDRSEEEKKILKNWSETYSRLRNENKN